MFERCEDVRFSREASQALPGSSVKTGQNVDRNVAVQLRIAGAVHLAHAACVKQADDFIRADARTRAQSYEAMVGEKGTEKLRSRS